MIPFFLRSQQDRLEAGALLGENPRRAINLPDVLLNGARQFIEQVNEEVLEVDLALDPQQVLIVQVFLVSESETHLMVKREQVAEVLLRFPKRNNLEQTLEAFPVNRDVEVLVDSVLQVLLHFFQIRLDVLPLTSQPYELRAEFIEYLVLGEYGLPEATRMANQIHQFLC